MILNVERSRHNPCIRDESSTACPGAFLATDGGSMAIPANQKEESFLQVHFVHHNRVTVSGRGTM